MSAAFWIVVLSIALVGVFIAWAIALAKCVRQESRQHQFNQWLLGNLVIMRVHVSRVSPEAAAVINALEKAHLTLSPVNAEQLESYLHVLRRAREAKLLESVTTVSKPGEL